jgi:hypothetical protein
MQTYAQVADCTADQVVSDLRYNNITIYTSLIILTMETLWDISLAFCLYSWIGWDVTILPTRKCNSPQFFVFLRFAHSTSSK